MVTKPKLRIIAYTRHHTISNIILNDKDIITLSRFRTMNHKLAYRSKMVDGKTYHENRGGVHCAEYSSQKRVSQQAITTIEYSLDKFTRSDHNVTFLGLLKREIVIYSICTGGFAILIFLSMLLLRQYRKTSMKAKSRHGTTENNFPEQNVANPSVRSSETAVNTYETTGGEYETIDESNMFDIHVSTNSRIIDEGSGNSSGYENENELHAGNINPSYESTVSETNVHDNSTDSNTLSNGSSSSSVTEGSGYLNPYQPIVIDADIHKYSNTIGIKDSSDSSSSETDKFVSDHLNPFQSSISFTDEHKEDGFETFVHIFQEKEKILCQSAVLENGDGQNSPSNKTQAFLVFSSSEYEAMNTNTDGTQMNAEPVDLQASE
ncbi:unnamed protein product [Mytilus coruscus]|uniref:Uncharacterized protein n=1 Tax=Mytilus coruscus TaxID=42192 RepID=A0A6J8A3Q6_MYTCO|nr:unnamed protein product [Mytilus coruscus]